MENLVMLSSLKAGQSAVIEKVVGLDLKKAKRLIELGFVKGTKVFVIKKTKGILLVAVRGFSLGIDKEIADGVIVWAVKS